MRTNFFHLLSLLMILSFSVSCGKDEAKKKTAHQPINPVYLPVNIPGVEGLRHWYVTDADYGTFPIPYYSNQYPGLQQFKEIRKKRVYTENCSKQPIKFLGLDLGDFQYCNQSMPEAVVLSETVIHSLPNVSKATFPKLAALMNGSLGQIVHVATTPGYQGKNIFVIDILKGNGQYMKVVVDTSIHPAFNPISSFDYETKTEEFVSKIKPPFL